MAADYDLLLQEIKIEHKRTGLDKSGYVYEHSDYDPEPTFNEHSEDTHESSFN
jgi:hypothetical protein